MADHVETLSYDPAALHWNHLHTTNTENMYCYCGQDRTLEKLNVQCTRCENWFHEDCLNQSLEFVMPFILNYRFTCGVCIAREKLGLPPRFNSRSIDPDEDLKLIFRRKDEEWERLAPTWRESILCALANMILEKKLEDQDYSSFFEVNDETAFSKEDVGSYIEAHWSILCIGKLKGGQWYSSMAATMHNNSDDFRWSNGSFTLSETNLFNLKPCAAEKRANVKRIDDSRKNGRLSQTADDNLDTQPIAATAAEALYIRSTGLDQFRYRYIPPQAPPEDQVFNNNYKYELAELDPLSNHAAGFRVQRTFPSLGIIEQTMLSRTDRAPQVKLEPDCKIVSNSGGYRTIRGNVGVKEGSWYFEVEVVQGGGQGKTDYLENRDGAHLRIGWSRREASLQGPVGYDSYGYAYRDKTGEVVHEGKPVAYGKPYKSGDVIGCLISLPPRPVPPRRQHIPEPDESEERLLTIEELPREALTLFAHERKQPALTIHNHYYFESTEYQPINHPPLLNALQLGTDVVTPETVVQPENRPFATPVTLQAPPWHTTLQSSQFPISEGSHITFFHNGVSQGVAFEDIPLAIPAAAALPADLRKPLLSHLPNPPVADDGSIGYYPTISMFRGGKARINFGPRFRFAPRTNQQWNPMSERVTEREVEDALWDAVDEVVAALEFEDKYGPHTSLSAMDALDRRDTLVSQFYQQSGLTPETDRRERGGGKTGSRRHNR